jgi:hypothetical protein
LPGSHARGPARPKADDSAEDATDDDDPEPSSEPEPMPNPDGLTEVAVTASQRRIVQASPIYRAFFVEGAARPPSPGADEAFAPAHGRLRAACGRRRAQRR